MILSGASSFTLFSVDLEKMHTNHILEVQAQSIAAKEHE